MHIYVSDIALFYVTAEMSTFSRPKKTATTSLTISRNINQQRAYLPSGVSIYENADAIRSRLIFLPDSGLAQARLVFLESGYQFPSNPPHAIPAARISITYLYNSRGSVNPTFQDLPFASHAFLSPTNP